MLGVVTAVLPVFGLILVGYLCRQRSFPGDGFWDPAEKLVFYLLFPALLFLTIARADFSTVSLAPLTLSVWIAMGAAGLFAYLYKLAVKLKGPAFTSLFQGALRMNVYIGLSISSALYGAEGLLIASVMVISFVPVANTLSVLALTRWGSKAAVGPLQLLVQVLRNPLILACIAGGSVNGLGVNLAEPLIAFIDLLARASLPIGLLAVGAGLDLKAAKDGQQTTFIACLIKLAAMPLVAWLCALGFGLEGRALGVLLVFAALPTASSSYIMARQMGGDAPLMANICTLQTLASLASLIFLISFLP